MPFTIIYATVAAPSVTRSVVVVSAAEAEDWLDENRPFLVAHTVTVSMRRSF